MLRRLLFVAVLSCFVFHPITSAADDGATMLRDYVKAKSAGIFVIMPNGDMRVGPVSAHHHDLAGGAEKVKDCVRGLIQMQDGKVVIQWFPPLSEMQRGNLRWIEDAFVKDFLEKLSKRTEGLRTALAGATLQLPLAKGGTRDISLGQLLGGGDELEKRMVRVVQESGHITPGEADEAIWVIDEGQEMKPRVAEKVKTARKEVMAISAGAQVELDKGIDMDRLMEDWRKTRPGARLQSPSPELNKIVRDIKDTPSGELKGMGLRDPEIKFQVAIKERLERAPVMQGIREKLPLRLEKKGLSPRVFQSKLREIMFNPSQLELGGADAVLGAFDVGASVAAGLLQTYDILFNRNLPPDQENLELGNAWVTALPVVGDFAQGLITGGQGWYEGDKGKLLEAGLWVSIGVMGCIPGGQLPAVMASISLATKPLVVGAYDARQAQNLVQAWVESGDWAMDQKPRRLKGLFDRDGKVHAITYEDLLTEKGNKPYKSEMADGLLGIDATINDSIRDYAEKYVMPQFTAIPTMRAGLKNLYPDFDDKVWKDEFTAKYKIEVRGERGGLALFNTYYVIRTQALQQTVVQLKTWAEDEMRAAKDYDSEVARLKGELEALQDELRCATLIQHADGSVEVYSRVIKNVWEQESLPLSRLRIYEHYVKTYRAVAGKLRRVSDLFRECATPYVPPSWHLTGFPEMDVDRVDTLLASMENGRKSVVEYIEKLLKDFDQPVAKYDPSNECHKKTFDVLAPLRYKVAFIENLILYYKQLAEGSSTWTSAYDTAVSNYKRSRDSIATSYKGKNLEIVFSQSFIDSFMTYVAAVPYSLASGEAELYRSTSRDYEVRLPGDRKEYEMATWTTGTGGKTLQGCLLAGLKVEITLSPQEPEEGQTVTARVKLTGGTPPEENYWQWKTSGGLTPSGRYGAEITLGVASEGTVTVELRDDFDKVLTTASVPVRPAKKDGKPGQAPATGSVKIIAPAAVKSTEIFAVKAELPPEIAKKAKSFQWESGYDTAYTTGPESTVQYPLNAYPKGTVKIRVHAGPLVDIWGGKAKDTSGEQLGEGTASVAVTVLKFDATASDIWEGGPYETGDGGVSFRRKSQTRKRTDGGKEVDSASASGGVTLEMKRDHKDVDCSAAWQMGGKPVPAGHTVRSMTIGPFKGDLIEKTFTSGYRGHYQFVDVAYPEAAVSGKGCVSFGKLAIQINYHGGASGTRLGQPPGIWYDDMPWVKGKVKEIHGEIQGILASVKLVPDGKRHSEPYKEKEIPIPVVKLRVSKEGKLKKGEVVDVTCVVENTPDDEKPLAYTWTGDHAGSGEKVQFLAAKGGKATLSVSVAGMQGPIGAASAQFEVEDLKVKITGLKDRVVYGTTARLSAQFDAPPEDKAAPPPADTGWKAPNEEAAQKVFYDTHARLSKACDGLLNKPTWKEFFTEGNRAQWMKHSECEEDARTQALKAKNCSLWPESKGCERYKPPAPETPKAPTGYRVVWQSEPGITFDPSTSDGSTTVLFDRMPAGGKIKIWAQLQKHAGGGSYATVGEAPQVETVVVPPVFKWKFEPEKGKGNVGKEVKVTITTVPEEIKPELLNYEWSYPESSKRMEYEKNASAIGFVPKDPKPVLLVVAPKVPFHRELIGGSLKEEYQAGAYTVTVTGPTARGPKPQVWQEGKGLVEVDRAIAAFQQVTLRAEVSPKPEKSPRWKWDVTPAGCTVSNDISQEITVSCSETGSYEAKATVKDPDGVELGSGAGSINVTISQQTLNESAKKAQESQDKTKKTDEARKKVQDAKNKARKGDYDGAIKDAEDAAKLDPANKDAAATAQKLRQEKETIHQQIDKAKKLMDENKFADAQKELIVASNLNSYYPPVPAANNELGERWRKYNAEVQDKVYQVRSANEKKDFGKALEIAAAWRTSTKLDPYAERELKQQEDWAKQWKAQKDRQIGILKAAGEKVKAYDYAGALKQYDEGFANGQNLYNGAEPEYKEAVELRSQAFTKNKRLNELIPWVRKAAEDKEHLTVDALNNTLKTADEAIALQPTNEQLKKWREQIVARAEKTKGDNERIAQGRKHLNAAGGAERAFLTNESSIQARQIQWGEKLEEQQQQYLTTAIENYRASLQYIPDATVEKKLKDLQATLEARKKYLAGVRQSIQIRAEADTLAQEARRDADFASSQAKFTQAAERYRQSLALWRPPDVSILERVIYGLELEKNDRAVKKYWADGQAVEKEGKIVEAIAIYDKAIASFHPTVLQNDRMYIIVHQQDLKNRVTGAKNWRADGEAKQKAGKIPEAIASYKQSLTLLPDAALAEHVRMLEGRQAEAGDKKAAAEKLWQEGTALFNQGRPSDALTKLKESLGYWSDATRQKYVADMEARRAKAVALRDEGSKLQGQNRIPEAVAKYKESLSYWPDTGLTSHIATLEGKLKQDADTAARKAKAKQLRDEGYALQQKNQLQAAIGKYKESLAIWPDPRLEDHIRQLEAKIAAVPPTKPTSPAGIGTVPSRDILTSKVWQFGRSDGTVLVSRMRLLPGGRIEGANNPNESQWALAGNEILFYDSSGKVSTRYNFFRQEGGRWVISGPFLLWGSITHVLREVADGGSPPAVTPVGSQTPTTPASTLSSAAWSGSWKSDPGPDGEVVTFALSQNGNRLTGTFQVDVPYTSATGARQKESLRGTIDGTVSGNRVTGNFREGSDKGPTGSFEFTMAAGGNLFTALVRGEDSSDTYTVRRSGSAATSGSVQTIGQTASRSVTAEITNRSKMNAHVFTEEENFGPGNRLAPGEKRKVAVTMKADGSVVFKAGRDGKVMATKTWRGSPGDASRVPVVVFDDTNPYDKLTVTTGLR